jgi:hypothetical protein
VGFGTTVVLSAIGVVRNLQGLGLRSLPGGTDLARLGPPVLPLPVALLLASASVIGFCFALQIIKDHPKHSTMHLAWQFITASCALGVIRYSFEAGAGELELLGAGNPLLGFRQVPEVLSTITLLVGLAGIWRAFSSLKIGVRIDWSHGIAIVAILLLTPVLYSFFAFLPDSQSAYWVVRVAQSANPVLMLSGAVLGVILHLISRELGRGEMRVWLRYLVGYLTLRPLMFVIRVLLISSSPVAAATLVGIARSTDWLFALMIFHRWVLTQRARDLARDFEAGLPAKK